MSNNIESNPLIFSKRPLLNEIALHVTMSTKFNQFDELGRIAFFVFSSQ